jgi:hypothetical protein
MHATYFSSLSMTSSWALRAGIMDFIDEKREERAGFYFSLQNKNDCRGGSAIV